MGHDSKRDMYQRKSCTHYWPAHKLLYHTMYIHTHIYIHSECISCIHSESDHKSFQITSDYFHFYLTQTIYMSFNPSNKLGNILCFLYQISTNLSHRLFRRERNSSMLLALIGMKKMFIYHSKKPSTEKSSLQMVANQEMLRPQWLQIKKLVRPTYFLFFVWLQNSKGADMLSIQFCH